jgi:lipopolysaccharide/colanic/teichoic acid biosynthesis glycosyltransferase
MFLSSNRSPGGGLIRATTARNVSNGTLNARDFEMHLRRERSLADRGSRVFTMIVLRRHRGDVEDVDVLAKRLKKRLRETDLIGRLDQNSLGILLTDTQPEGAVPVANFIDRVVDPLGLEMERKLYVYPSASESLESANGRRDDEDDGNSFMPLPSETAAPIAYSPDAEPAPGFDVGPTAPARPGAQPPAHPKEAAALHGAAPDLGGRMSARWSIGDLWAELVEPLPVWKRSIDVAFAGAGLIALAPVFLCVAIAIKIDSPGPIFFSQTRLGRGRKPFRFYKFRSMTSDAEDRRAELEPGNETHGPTFKIRHDPRKTRVGRLIRRSSIDELPQLWNVLRGDFSLVGPRPPIPDEVEHYQRWQKRRLDVAGGLTCIWQVNGRSEVAFEEWMRMDMHYVARNGFWLDLKLLAKTFRAVLSGRGAY